MSAARLTAENVYEGLRKRYPSNEWALLPQVANATGSAVRGWADALAMNLWPSRGLALHGFEIKVSRSDWLRELKKPEKADGFVAKCDYWWLAVSDKNIVQPGELPDGWGLLYMHGSTLRCATQAVERRRSDEFSRSFLAAILRQAAAVVTPQATLDAAERRGYERGKSERDARHEVTDKQMRQLEQRVRDFERASGVSLASPWTPAEKIGAAVRQVLDGTAERSVSQLKAVGASAERVAAAVAKELERLETA